MKNLKNSNVKISKKTMIFIILILVFIFCYLEYNKNLSEGFLLPNCIINQNIQGPSTSDFQLSSNTDKSPTYECKTENTNFFYYNSLNNYNQYFIEISNNNNFSNCGDIGYDISYDFYTKNNNKCKYYQLSSTIYNNNYKPDISTLLYVSCSGDISPKFYKNLGPGGFSENGFNKMKDNKFKYLAYANNACALDYKIDNTKKKLKQCIDSAKTKNKVYLSLEKISSCFNNHGNKLFDYISGDFGDLNNRQFYDNIPKYNINSENKEDIFDSSYINNFYDSVISNSLSDDIYQEIVYSDSQDVLDGVSINNTNFELDYNNILNKQQETKMEYKSTYLRNLFVIIVLIITSLLILFSIITPDLISIEILVIYVLLILLLIFFGTKYFNIFQKDVSNWKYSVNNWFQRNILNN